MHDRTPLRVPPHPSPGCRAPNLVAHLDLPAPPPLKNISRAKVLVARATKPHSGITTSVDPTAPPPIHTLAPQQWSQRLSCTLALILLALLLARRVILACLVLLARARFVLLARALHTVSAPSGEERTLGAAAQVERATRCCRRFDGRTHACCGRVPNMDMELISAASGPRVSGCIRACRY